MADPNNRGTAGSLGASDLPSGYRIDGESLTTPSGLRVKLLQTGDKAVDISNRTGNTVHIPFEEWEYFAPNFVMPSMTSAQQVNKAT